MEWGGVSAFQKNQCSKREGAFFKRCIRIIAVSAVGFFFISVNASALRCMVRVVQGQEGEDFGENPDMESLELHDSARTPTAQASGRGIQLEWCFLSVWIYTSLVPGCYQSHISHMPGHCTPERVVWEDFTEQWDLGKLRYLFYFIADMKN